VPLFLSVGVQKNDFFESYLCAGVRRAGLGNVSDAGVEALAEAGCGTGLQTLILGAVFVVSLVSYCGIYVAFRNRRMFTIPRCSLVLLWLPCREMPWFPRNVFWLRVCVCFPLLVGVVLVEGCDCMCS